VKIFGAFSFWEDPTDGIERACAFRSPWKRRKPGSISPATLPNGTVGVLYHQQLTANGGTAPYTFTVPPDSVPMTSTGLIDGIPNEANLGTHTFVVTVTDANRCTGTRSYTITINCPPLLTITTNCQPPPPPPPPPLICQDDEALNFGGPLPCIFQPPPPQCGPFEAGNFFGSSENESSASITDFVHSLGSAYASLVLISPDGITKTHGSGSNWTFAAHQNFAVVVIRDHDGGHNLKVYTGVTPSTPMSSAHANGTVWAFNCPALD
jgi:hypothetical protein